MSGHTPGPWQHSAKLSASENHRGFSIWTADGWALADVQPADQDGKEGEANARLIAASPDLLAAVKLARTSLILIGPGGNRLAYHDALRALDAAISKAEAS